MSPAVRWCVLCVSLGVLLVSSVMASDGEHPAQARTRQDHPPARDVTDASNAALYAVGYSHLDTQWRWDFVQSIDAYLLDTLDHNFDLFERYPEYTFSFTGSVRYEMMKEYYPARYERLKSYIDAGRWFVSGSSVEEGDVLVPSPESIIRQVLYGNLFFEREFGKTSTDFMLPDCFGFPWSLPSAWAHCGLLGFSTQKLTWGSAIGIPFGIGVWEGPDGHGVIAALNPGSYNDSITDYPADQDPSWAERISVNGERFDLHADFHYYGVGDMGGAPPEAAVVNYTESGGRSSSLYDVILPSSDDLFEDITPAIRARLPRHSGDMLLTEHSSGTLTSQSYVKRWNRHAELLLDAAERASVAAWWLGFEDSSREKLERSWVRTLATQMHDIVPGTSVPVAYTYSWNDQILSLNLAASTLTSSVGAVASRLDTRAVGTPVVVFNPSSFARRDIAQARVDLGGASYARVFDPDGVEVPSQVVERAGSMATVLFVTDAEPVSFGVYDVRGSDTAFDDNGGPSVTPDTLENARYRVRINEAGDIASVYDKLNGRELLSAPAGLVFTFERPREWPAWNMDWKDRRQPPFARVEGPATVRIVEDGPVRVALAITRHAQNSEFTQTIRLARADAGDVVEVKADVDWQSTETALKASFPLSVSNPEATYNLGLGTIRRGNNDPAKYEVPSHEWFNLTDRTGDYGVTVVEDSKFGSDKPADNEVRLTLLYTPGVRNAYLDQHSQDWGLHEIRYGVFGHTGDWRDADSYVHARHFNQPVRTFVVPKSDGPLGRSFGFVTPSEPRVAVRALKLGERRDVLVVRVREMEGRDADGVRLTFPSRVVSVREVDGQERAIDGSGVSADGQSITFSLSPYFTRAFEVELAPPSESMAGVVSRPVSLPRDTEVASSDGVWSVPRGMDHEGRNYPVEMLPRELVDDGVRFELASADEAPGRAVACRGQTIELPDGGDRVHLLAAATADAEATFAVGGLEQRLGVQQWTGFIGQWDDRVFDTVFPVVDYINEGRVKAIVPGYIKRDPVAWFATHRHHPDNENEAYRFSYLFHYALERPDGATTLTLPHDERIRVFAVSVADTSAVTADPAAPLYDSFDDRPRIEMRHDYDTFGYSSGVSPLPRTPSHDRLGAPNEVTIDRAERFADLSMGPPSSDDLGDRSVSGAVYRYFDVKGELMPHPLAGAEGDTLPRLNDGDVARHDDDVERSVWFDYHGRFGVDLGRAVSIDAIRVYSWHRGDRAPQDFTVWGSNAEEMPDPLFSVAEGSGWEFVAAVNTLDLGHGGTHGSAIRGRDRPMGPYRWLLWVAPAKQSGTFFSEIDIESSSDGER
ncbi:MAG: glycoside hydrolase family 38 C-terminal domain-containing protein [Planctomycetota bacterium]